MSKNILAYFVFSILIAYFYKIINIPLSPVNQISVSLIFKDLKIIFLRKKIFFYSKISFPDQLCLYINYYLHSSNLNFINNSSKLGSSS